MANVLLGVTGSVAAIKAPLLYQELTARGHAVKVAATAAALYFFDPAEIAPRLEGGRPVRNPDTVILDEDEWPGSDAGVRYRREDRVLHIELRRWADVLVIAPLDANTLAKLAGGLCDNCLTCVYRAWEPTRPVVLAPAMNTLMWQHPATARHLRQVAEDAGATDIPPSLALDDLLGWLGRHRLSLRVVEPDKKALACGDIGVGALAPPERIAAVVAEALGLPS